MPEDRDAQGGDRGSDPELKDAGGRMPAPKGGRSVKLPGSVAGQWRRRLDRKGELLLALLPTATVLIVFFLVEILTQQRVLYASLAASAFLIYLDPEHTVNSVRTLVLSQLIAATVGLLTYELLSGRYLAGGLAMLVTIVVMILFDALHPPAVATSLSFAFRAGEERNLIIFALAVMVTAMLVALQRGVIWLLRRYGQSESSGGTGETDG